MLLLFPVRFRSRAHGDLALTSAGWHPAETRKRKLRSSRAARSKYTNRDHTSYGLLDWPCGVLRSTAPQLGPGSTDFPHSCTPRHDGDDTPLAEDGSASYAHHHPRGVAEWEVIEEGSSTTWHSPAR